MSRAYYNPIDFNIGGRKERKMKQTVTFKRYGRWYYNVKSITHRHPKCSENGYAFRLTAIIKGMRRRT